MVYLFGGIGAKELLLNTLSSGFLFIAIFVASLSNATPVVKSGRVLYGICVGIMSAIMINVVHFNVGVYIGILVLGLLSPLFNKFRVSLD